EAGAGPGCEKKAAAGRYRRSGRHQVPVAVLPTAKSLSAFSLKPQSDRLLRPAPQRNKFAPAPVHNLAPHAAQIFLVEVRKANNATNQQEQNHELGVHKAASS